jgi:DNA-directed RNA polymerase subunit M/transcription elongation factor TFIIS
MAELIPWQARILAASILYLSLEQNVRFTSPLKSDERFLSHVLADMVKAGLMVNEAGRYAVTDKGQRLMKTFIGAIDTIRQFNPCIAVDLRELTPDEWISPERPAEVRWDIFDPRFVQVDNPDAVDMRLALIQWSGNKIGKEIDPHEVVFLYRLGAGHYSNNDFYFHLLDGRIFKQIEETVAGSFKWQEMDQNGDPEVASRRMQALYTACQIENRKRDSFPCGNCGIPLAMFQDDAKQNGQPFTGCPSCGHQFAPPPPDAFECPRCKSLLYPGDQVCSGCGSLVDLSLPLGASQTDTTVTETPVVFTRSYGYVSYGWVDPYDVLISAYMFDVFYDPYW